MLRMMRSCFGWEKGSNQVSLMREMCPKCEEVVVVIRNANDLICRQCVRPVNVQPKPRPREDPLLRATAKRLGIASETKERAYDLFKFAAFVAFRCSPEGVLAACVFLACKDRDQPRTVEEIASAAALGATAEEIEKIEKVADVLFHALRRPQGPEEDPNYAAHYVKHFCEELGLSGEAVQAAMDAAMKADEMEGRVVSYLPDVIAAAAIYLVSQLFDEKKTLEDVSGTVPVDHEELKFAAMDIQPHLGIVKDMELFPKGVKPPELAGIEETVEKLCLQLGMSDQDTRAAVEAAENAETPETPRSRGPALVHLDVKTCVAVGIVNLILILSKDKNALENLQQVTGFTHSMMAQCHSNLHPQAVHIVPEWYAKPADVMFESVAAY